MNIIYRNINSSSCFLFKTAFSNHVNRNIAFKSAVSLNTLYPNSSLKLTTSSEFSGKEGQFSGYIPIELDITYSRSTGPGGQNVNKVNTKVDLRFNVQSATWISDEVKSKLIEKFKTQITKDGFIVFRSDLTRSQQLNLADCLEKVRSAIRKASVISPEISAETQEKLRRRQERIARERLNLKRQRSQIKEDRKVPNM